MDGINNAVLLSQVLQSHPHLLYPPLLFFSFSFLKMVTSPRNITLKFIFSLTFWQRAPDPSRSCDHQILESAAHFLSPYMVRSSSLKEKENNRNPAGDCQETGTICKNSSS